MPQSIRPQSAQGSATIVVRSLTRAQCELRADRRDRDRTVEQRLPGCARILHRHGAHLLEQLVQRQDPPEHLDRPGHVIGAALRRFERHQQPGLHLRAGATELGFGQPFDSRRRALRARAATDSAARARSAAQPIPTSPVSANAWLQA